MMNFPNQIRLGRHMVVVVSLGLAFSYNAYAAAQVGSVSLSSGTVTAKEKANLRSLKRKDPVNNGELIETGKDSFVQIRFVDGGRVSLQENAQLELNDVTYKDAQGKADSFTVSLTKGSFRAISGQIGKESRENYRFKTPLATVGVRGTVFDGNSGIFDPSKPDALFKDGVLPPDFKPPGSSNGPVFFLNLRVTEGSIGAVFPSGEEGVLVCCDPSLPQSLVAIGRPNEPIQIFYFTPDGLPINPVPFVRPELPPADEGGLATPADNLFRPAAPATIAPPAPSPTIAPAQPPSPTLTPTLAPTIAPTLAPVPIPDIIPGIIPDAAPNTSTPIPDQFLNPIEEPSNSPAPSPITSPGF